MEYLIVYGIFCLIVVIAICMFCYAGVSIKWYRINKVTDKIQKEYGIKSNEYRTCIKTYFS